MEYLGLGYTAADAVAKTLQIRIVEKIVFNIFARFANPENRTSPDVCAKAKANRETKGRTAPTIAAESKIQTPPIVCAATIQPTWARNNKARNIDNAVLGVRDFS